MDIIETMLTHQVLGYVQEKNVVLWQLDGCDGLLGSQGDG
jgi:hypothetical protein